MVSYVGDDSNDGSPQISVFYETLRMFPPVNGIPKQSAEDTSIVVGNASGVRVAIPCPKGTRIAIHTPGLHYNRTCYVMSVLSDSGID